MGEENIQHSSMQRNEKRKLMSDINNMYTIFLPIDCSVPHQNVCIPSTLGAKIMHLKLICNVLRCPCNPRVCDGGWLVAFKLITFPDNFSEELCVCMHNCFLVIMKLFQSQEKY